MMIDMRIQLTEGQDQRLEVLSAIRRVPKTELVQQAVGVLLAQPMLARSPEEQRQRALAIIGRFRSGDRDVAERHDDYLAEAYEG